MELSVSVQIIVIALLPRIEKLQKTRREPFAICGADLAIAVGVVQQSHDGVIDVRPRLSGVRRIAVSLHFVQVDSGQLREALAELMERAVAEVRIRVVELKAHGKFLSRVGGSLGSTW